MIYSAIAYHNFSLDIAQYKRIEGGWRLHASVIFGHHILRCTLGVHSVPSRYMNNAVNRTYRNKHERPFCSGFIVLILHLILYALSLVIINVTCNCSLIPCQRRAQLMFLVVFCPCCEEHRIYKLSITFMKRINYWLGPLIDDVIKYRKRFKAYLFMITLIVS